MAQLLDYRGMPVNTAALKRPETLAQTGGMRSVWTGAPTSGLTPQRLAGILRAAENFDTLSYLELAEQMEERDLHYLSVLGTRKRAISQLPIKVVAATDTASDKAIAAFIDDWLQRDTLQAELFDMLDAVGKGFSVTRISWDTSEGQWRPGRLDWVDPRWFNIDRVDGRTLSLRGEAVMGQPLPAFEYVVHEHPAKSGLPIRGGLAKPVAWAWMIKNYAVKDWAAFAEVYGLPMRVGKYGPGATPAEIATLMSAVADMGGDAAAVIPQSMLIEFEGAQGASSPDMFEKLHDKMDQQVSKAVLGQTATTDAIAGGHAVGREHNDVRGDIERSDAKLLAATLNIQLVRAMVDLNYGPQKRYPKLVIGQEEAEDLTALVKAVVDLVPLGLRVEASVMADKFGLPEPGPDAILLTAPKPAQGPPADLGGGAQPADGRQGPPEASQGLSGGPPSPPVPLPAAASAVAGPAGVGGPDAVEQLADQLAGDGDWMIAPLAAAALALLEEAGDLTTFRDRLAELAQAEADPQLVQRLARGNLNAFLAGASGQPLHDTEEPA